MTEALGQPRGVPGLLPLTLIICSAPFKLPWDFGDHSGFGFSQPETYSVTQPITQLIKSNGLFIIFISTTSYPCIIDWNTRRYFINFRSMSHFKLH